MLPALIPKNKKYPIWDPINRKFSNHYCFEEVMNVLNLIEDLHIQIYQVTGDDTTRIPEIKIARCITKLRNPPTPVVTWVVRLMKVYYCAPLLNAVRTKTISTRFALSELANRVGNRKFEKIFDQACAGSMTCAEFRRQSILITKGKNNGKF